MDATVGNMTKELKSIKGSKKFSMKTALLNIKTSEFRYPRRDVEYELRFQRGDDKKVWSKSPPYAWPSSHTILGGHALTDWSASEYFMSRPNIV